MRDQKKQRIGHKRMKTTIRLLLLILVCASKNLVAQNSPVWIYTIADSYYSYESADINLRTGDVFVQFNVGEVVPCFSNHASSVLINNTGSLVWENVFDTTNGCVREIATTCSAITSPTSTHYVASPYYFTGPDSAYSLVYNQAGQTIASDYVGFSYHYVENMDDGFCYHASVIERLVFKTDSLGNQIWNYTLPDSNDLHSLYPNIVAQRLLATTLDYSQSPTDKKLHFFGFDTSGFLHFNSSINLVPNSNETINGIWFTNDRKIVGVISLPSSSIRFFSVDTAANLNIPIVDLQVPSYHRPVYDSVHNLLHYFKSTGSGTGRLYSLDCSTGIIQDSIFLDTVSGNPKLAIDQAGNLILASYYINSNTNSFYVKRFTHNYYLDWKGVIPVPPASTSALHDVKTDTSNNIYLFYQHDTLEHIAKFSPPLVSGINEPNPYKNQLQLVPNPASSEVTIRRKETSDLPSTLLIRDVSGKLIQQLNIPAHQTSYTFSTNDIPAGVYFVAWGTGVASKLVVIH